MDASDDMTPAAAPREGPAVRLLGLAQATAAGALLALPDRALAILAMLAAAPRRSLRRNELRAVVFGEQDAERAGVNLRQTLTRLRRLQLEHDVALIEETADEVRLAAGLRVDLVDFLAPAPQETGDTLRRRLALYRGDLMDGFAPPCEAFDDWLGERRERLRAQYLEIVGVAVAAPTLLSEAERIELARRALRLDPTREQIAGALMRILIDRGDADGAQAVYETLRAALARDLAAAPDAVSRALFEEARAAAGRAAAPAVSASAPVSPASALIADDRRAGCPRVLILPPLAVETGAIEDGLFAAFLEDVTVGLARYRSMTVLAAHTARRVAAGEAATRAGADYLVSTALRPRPAGAAVSVRLSEAETGLVMWVADFEWRAAELPAIFAELVRHVVDSLVDVIERATLKMPAAAPDATAYRLLLEGRRCLETVDLPHLRRARKWFRQAIGRAEGYAAAHADLARTLVLEHLVLGTTDASPLDEAAGVADRAIALDPAEWSGLRARALADLYARRHEPSLERFAAAARLAPADADLRAEYADALAFSGEPEQGIGMIREAMRLNPLHPGYYDWILGSILFQTGRYVEALAALEPVKDNPAVSRLLAATCARAGDAAAARLYARRLRENYPGFRADDMWRLSPNRRAEDTRHLVEALKAAGVD
ncbi:MAG: hypothetical protein JNK46_12335 [Methylobacteriaceae bacterium]|nr:hypothetical protein [Methylobacteriaceae bacterium]